MNEFIETPEVKEEEILVETSPFDLDIDDKELATLIDTKVSESQAFYKNKKNLDSRRKKNVDYWMGKQVDEAQFHSYQVPYVDNLIYQNTETRISIATSRVPDVVVTAAGEDDDKRENAKLLQQALTIKLDKAAIKRVLKNGLRDNHLKYIGIAKVRWDATKGDGGDFIFETVDPNNVVIDHTAKIPEDEYTIDNAEFVSEYIEEPIQVILDKFPAKKEELLRELGIVGTPRQLKSKIRYQEVWFTWYDKGMKYEGVCWKYRQFILDKKKHPYFDWEGYEDEGKKYYYNHFSKPRKPYMLFSYNNLGESPIDDTTPVEQSLKLQDNVNKRGRQITEIADRAVPKMVFAGRYIQREDVRNITQSPDESIYLEKSDDVNKAFALIPAQSPSAVLFDDLMSNRNQIDSKFNTHATTRGERTPNESGIARQITREGDLAATDDVVSIVLERVFYEMANWAVQMMKTQYDEKHLIRNNGKDGELIYIEMQRDKIDDGIMVNVQSSTTDRAVKRDNALTLAQFNQIDPLSLMEDLDLPSPKARARRMLSYMQAEEAGFAQYIQDAGLETEEEKSTREEQENAEMQQQEAQQQIPPAVTQAQEDIKMLLTGAEVEPKEITPEYIQVFIQFVNSPEFQELMPEVKENIMGFVQKMRAMAGNVQQ